VPVDDFPQEVGIDGAAAAAAPAESHTVSVLVA
jgi:hypothetical protein